MCSVYVHTVNKNGKRYVGQCSGDVYARWGSSGHRYKGQFFYKAILKYGWDNITHEIVATGLTKEQADDLEKKLIAKYKSNQREFGYNITPGGRDGAGSPGGKNHNARPVICIETNQTWECSTYCARDLCVNLASLQESLYNGYKCKGFHFRYLDDKNYVPNKEPKQVICVETGQVWKTVRECAKELKVHARNIHRYCAGSRKPKNGLHYEYYVA